MKFRALIASAGAILALAGPAMAFPVEVTNVPLPVWDHWTEESTGTTANNTTTLIRQTDSVIQALTIGGGAGFFYPAGGDLATLDSALWGARGIAPANFSENFPGWRKLPPNSSQAAADITTHTMQTYLNAMAVAQRQGNEIEGENFSGLEAGLRSTSTMTVLQTIGEIGLQQITQTQYLRQLLITEIAIQTTQAAETLNEKAQQAATQQSVMLGGR